MSFFSIEAVCNIWLISLVIYFIENCRTIRLSSRYSKISRFIDHSLQNCAHYRTPLTPGGGGGATARTESYRLASAYPPKPLHFYFFEVGPSHDLQSLCARFHRIWPLFAPTSPTPEAQSPEDDFSIRVSSQTPTFLLFSGRPLT